MGLPWLVLGYLQVSELKKRKKTEIQVSVKVTVNQAADRHGTSTVSNCSKYCKNFQCVGLNLIFVGSCSSCVRHEAQKWISMCEL